MIAKIIVAFLLVIVLILLMYGAIIGIKENDKAYAVVCSTAAGLVGLLCGFVLGSLLI
jgi:membrane protein DedA with SNARE-associated domain